MNKDEKVLAYCNLFGVLGAIPTLLETVPEARALVAEKRISVGFQVKDGPEGTLCINNGTARMLHGIEACNIKLYFASCKKFNDMIDGKGNPLPVSGVWHSGFLRGEFSRLTDLRSAYLRPKAEDMADPVFFERSTVLMLHVIAGAVAEIANHDQVGRFSASNIVDGVIKVAIANQYAVAVEAKDHMLTVLDEVPEKCFSQMCFDSLKTARDLFDGRINAVASVGEGKVRIGGMISQVDNVNRILDRVAIYLA